MDGGSTREENGSPCGTSVTWLGHAAVLVEDGVTRVVTDPLLRTRLAHLRRSPPLSCPGPVDAVLVSHVHWDHLDISSLRTFDRGVRFYVPPGAGSLLRGRGIALVEEVAPGDRLSFPGFDVEVTRARHTARRTPVSPVVPALGFVFSGSVRTYFAGDTDVFSGMAALGPVDLALLPIAGWTKKVPPGHLDAVRAVEALRLLQARYVVPIHWGTYHPHPPLAPREHELDEPLERFREELAARMNGGPVLRVLRPGDTFCVPPQERRAP